MVKILLTSCDARVLLLPACILLYAGCARLPSEAGAGLSTRVSAQALAAKQEERYESSDGVRYRQPIAAERNPLPQYPLNATTKPETVVVVVRLIVDESGEVVSVIPLEPDGANLFFDSVRAACSQWRFQPLLEIRRYRVASTDADGTIEFEWRSKEVALPFHLDYKFQFSAAKDVALQVQ